MGVDGAGGDGLAVAPHHPHQVIGGDYRLPVQHQVHQQLAFHVGQGNGLAVLQQLHLGEDELEGAKGKVRVMDEVDGVQVGAGREGAVLKSRWLLWGGLEQQSLDGFLSVNCLEGFSFTCKQHDLVAFLLEPLGQVTFFPGIWIDDKDSVHNLNDSAGQGIFPMSGAVTYTGRGVHSTPGNRRLSEDLWQF